MFNEVLSVLSKFVGVGGVNVVIGDEDNGLCLCSLEVDCLTDENHVKHMIYLKLYRLFKVEYISQDTANLLYERLCKSFVSSIYVETDLYEESTLVIVIKNGNLFEGFDETVFK